MFKLKVYNIFLDQIYYMIYFIIFTNYFISYLNYATGRDDQYQYVMLTVFVYSVSFFFLSFFPPQAFVIAVKTLFFIHFVAIQPILEEKKDTIDSFYLVNSC